MLQPIDWMPRGREGVCFLVARRCAIEGDDPARPSVASYISSAPNLLYGRPKISDSRSSFFLVPTNNDVFFFFFLRPFTPTSNGGIASQPVEEQARFSSSLSSHCWSQGKKHSQRHLPQYWPPRSSVPILGPQIQLLRCLAHPWTQGF